MQYTAYYFTEFQNWTPSQEILSRNKYVYWSYKASGSIAKFLQIL